MCSTVEVTMEILEGLRGDVTFYHVNDFLYKRIQTYNKKNYYHCSNKSCNASYIVDTNTNTSKFLRHHNHPPDKTKVEQYKFLTILRKRARTENMASRALFAECLLGFSPEAIKHIGPFEKHKKIIYKARNSSPLFGTKEGKQPPIKLAKPQFTILDGLRSDTKVYLCDEFLYFFRKAFNDKNYYACSEKTCSAKLTYDSNTQDAVITKPHNHASDSSTIEYHKFLTTIRSRSREETVSIKELFAECLKELSPEAVATVGSYERHKKIMYNARSNPTKAISNFEDSEDAEVEERWVPETLWELFYALDKPLNYKHHALRLKQLRRNFLRFYEDGEHPQLIFVTSSIKNQVAFISEESEGLDVHIDTSFNMDPKQNFYICCLNILYKKMVFPLIFSIMLEKSFGAFTSLLKRFKEIKGDAYINSVLTDNQSELDEAVKTVLPDAVLKGSWFHYARETLTEAQRLIGDCSEDPIKEKAVKMSMVLPLLPNNYYRQGVNFIKKYAPLPETFISYLTDRWRNANISTFGEDVGVHYSIELFSMDVQRVVGADRADVWKFLEAFLEVLYMKSSTFITVKDKSHITVYRNTYIQLLNEIESEQAKFLRLHDVPSLLENLCDCMKGLSESSKSIKEEEFVKCENEMEDAEMSPIASPKMEESDCLECKEEDEEMEEDFEEIILHVVSEDETAPEEEG